MADTRLADTRLCGLGVGSGRAPSVHGTLWQVLQGLGHITSSVHVCVYAELLPALARVGQQSAGFETCSCSAQFLRRVFDTGPFASLPALPRLLGCAA